MGTTQYRVLDLFAGLGGFSAAFEESDRWDVISVDINPEFNTEITADVFELRPSDFDQVFDVVLASPPCTQFSPMAHRWEKQFDANGTPLTDDAATSVGLVYHTLGLIHAQAPTYWFLENPRGALRRVIGLPTATIDYCAYGHYTKKPTDLWGEHPPMTYKRCPHDTHTDENGVTDMERGPSSAKERAKVPYGVSEAICNAVESGLDNTAPTQTTADMW